MLEEKWRILLLNGLSMHQGPHSVHRFRTQKTAELLVYLALNPNREISREELADRIWPDSDAEAGRASLRTALASLRKQLEPPGTEANSVLHTNRLTVRLEHAAIETDVELFNASYSLVDLSAPTKNLEPALRCIQLYSGQLVPQCFGDWIITERDRLNELYRSLLRFVIVGFGTIGDVSQALHYARQLMETDPISDEAYVMTMELHAVAGRKPEATRCYHQLERILQEELGEEPSSDVKALAVKIESGNEDIVTQSFVHSYQRSSLDGRQQASAASLPSGTEGNEMGCPLPSAGARVGEHKKSRVPPRLNRFFGRESELLVIADLLDTQFSLSGVTARGVGRLVTLTGVGGAGKTRIATELAQRYVDLGALAVVFIGLSEIREPHRIVETIANMLEIPQTVGPCRTEAAIEALNSLPHLLVLDNLEQLLSPSPDGSPSENEAADVLSYLLERVPTLRLLVTSRQSLDIEGEVVYSIAPLPAPSTVVTPEELKEFASVQLFVDRAQLACPDFQLTRRNSEVVGKLCARLEGLPLALELAAAWASILSLNQIAERLERRFDLMISRRKGRFSRHATLRAAIEWSYLLLEPDLQEFFARLSVFRDGWTLEAAEYLQQAGKRRGFGSASRQVVEYLHDLCSRSLVTVDLKDPENGDPDEENTDKLVVPRFRMLETLREFAAEQILESEYEFLRRDHLYAYCKWSEKVRPGLVGPDQVSWLKQVEREKENVRAAISWSLDDIGSCREGLNTFTNLRQYWCLRGNYGELKSTVDQFLTHPEAQDPASLRLDCLRFAAQIDGYLGDWKSAIRVYEICLDTIQQLPTPQCLGSLLACIGAAHFHLGDLVSARINYDASLDDYKLSDDTNGIASVYGCLGILSQVDKDYETAATFTLRAIELERKENQLSGITHHLVQLGECYIELEELAKACACFEESLDGYWQLRDSHGLAILINYIAGRWPISEATVRLMGAAQALNAATAATSLAAEAEVLDRARSTLGDSRFEVLWEEGERFSPQDAISLARTVLTSN